MPTKYCQLPMCRKAAMEGGSFCSIGHGLAALAITAGPILTKWRAQNPSVHVRGDEGRYNRRLVIIAGREMWIPDRAFRCLVTLAAARVQRRRLGGWVWADELGCTFCEAQVAANLIRRMLNLRVEWDHAGRRRLGVHPDRIWLNVPLLREDRDHRISGLFKREKQ